MEKIHLLDYIKPFWKHRVPCFLIVVCCTGSAILYSFFLPKLYRSATVILPIESSRSFDASSLSGGFGGRVGGYSNVNRLVMYLSSVILQKRVAKALGVSLLKKNNTSLNDQEIDQVIGMLSNMVDVANDRVYPDKIKLQVTGGDPQLVAYIARQYLAELQNFLTGNALIESKRNGLLLEEQIAKSKEEMLEMGKALASFYGKNSISAESAKLNIPVGVYTSEGVRNFKNYEEFKQYFEVFQKDQNERAISDEEVVRVVYDVPHQLYLQYLTTQQQMLESDLAMLNQRQRMAKLETMKREPFFQVLEDPFVPQFSFSPNKKLIAKEAFFVSLLLAYCYSLRGASFVHRVRFSQHHQQGDVEPVKNYKVMA